jgi:hypothetical protein
MLDNPCAPQAHHRHVIRALGCLEDKVVEAIVRLKSWAGEDVYSSMGSHVVDAEHMRVDLQKQSEAITGTTEEE